MGNGLVADASGTASAWYNPSLASFTVRQYATLGYALLSQDRRFEGVQFAMPLRPRAGVTVGLLHTGVRNIDGRDQSGFHTGMISTGEFVGYLAFGLRFYSDWAAGIALRFYHHTLYESVSPAKSLGLSFGMVGRVSSALWVGWTLDDLLARYVWDTSGSTEGARSSDRFPLRLRIGASYLLQGGRGVLTMEYESRVRRAEIQQYSWTVIGGRPVQTTYFRSVRLHQSWMRIGGEYWIVPQVALRLGLDGFSFSEGRAIQPALGVGFRWNMEDIEGYAAFASMREPYDNGWRHLLSLRFYL